jgi:hypothetical protein
MPHFTSEPPKGLGHSGMPIVRTPAKRPFLAWITCRELVGTPTHYVNHRTVPCEGEAQCKHCLEGVGWRWHAYLSVLTEDTHEHVLWEMTARASDPIRAYAKMHGSLRGAKIKATRANGKPNGRLIVLIRSDDAMHLMLPEPPIIPKVLCHIWGIPYTLIREARTARPGARQVIVDPADTDGRRKRPKSKPPR